MFNQGESCVPSLSIPLGLNLEHACELRGRNSIHRLQQNYQASSNEVTQITTSLGEFLAHLQVYSEEGRRRPRDS